ncbi:uncharacterized protein LOC134248237 [Saccostrea cucullata]|uniref:uncharacterized protein LOC134248237 n=1 Tax=Saccostrea cuccullata TaxID=36930 RepID=UPI002ED1E906
MVDRERRANAGAKMLEIMKSLKENETTDIDTTPVRPSPAAKGQDGQHEKIASPRDIADLESKCQDLERKLQQMKLENKYRDLQTQIQKETEMRAATPRPVEALLQAPLETETRTWTREVPQEFQDGAELRQALRMAASRLRTQGWAVSTKKTYQAQLTCYLDFCAKVNLPGVPAAPEQIILYIAYLVDVKSFKYSTIKNYLNIVKHLHCANDLDDPIHGVWSIQQTLKGAKRELGDAQGAATPIQPRHLLLIRSSLCLDLKEDLSFWTACLIAFFGLLRPGNFLSQGPICVPDRDLCIQNISPHAKGFLLSLNWTKTLQFREQQLQVTLPDLHGHPLCPASALRSLFHLLFIDSLTSDTSPLLQKANGEPLSYSWFLSRLRRVLPGVDITGHSFRRGGATWAFQQGLQGELIQELGFWKSNAYLRYLESTTDQKFEKMYQFGRGLPFSL